MTVNPRDQHHPSRRTVVRGAAWAVPTVAVATAAPAFAASPCTTSGCPNLAFGTANPPSPISGGNGWSYTTNYVGAGTGFSSNPTGFQAARSASPFTGKGVTFAASAEPNTANRRLTLAQTGQPALSASCRYTVSVGIITWTNDNSAPLVLRVMVGTTPIGTYSTAGEPSAAETDRGIKSFPVPSGTAGAVSFQLDFSVADDHEDIYLYTPSISCA